MRMENRELMETTSKVIAGGQRRAMLPSFLRDRGGKRAARLAACALLAGVWLLGGTGTTSAGEYIEYFTQ